MTYYSLGRWIVETQQMGEKRAKYSETGMLIIMTGMKNWKLRLLFMAVFFLQIFSTI